ncbi:RepB family plasmid replication initiator protein [Falsigemmobacter faecalis]|uniref:RepB family plasmid replication initiator protein n=2 Tax=Falsigemmobacter faecalis TaxID=2488730 RepID=A0A3P3D6M0_9RHOB|nr:RepB family plasmid replication initiator protein [Falsigemmobacter faecalis]
MDSDQPNQALLPDRHPQYDLFICDVSDAVLKDVMQQMEHPIYSLSKKPDTSIRRYLNGEDWIEVIPSVKGLATIYDKDILIYCISQIVAKMKRGEEVSPRVRLNSRELLIFTNRSTGGREYQTLIDALDRLEGTRIRTNIRTGAEEQSDSFGLINATSTKRTHGLNGRLLSCEIQLSDWVFSAIRSNEVLTLHRDYFRLRKPIERRLYELARKHCGQQKQWRVSLDKLLLKTGSTSQPKRFKQAIREIVATDHLPDYRMALVDENDMVVFINRGSMPVQVVQTITIPALDPEVYEMAREATPGWDVHYIEAEWRAWATEAPRNPEMAFLGFCRKWFEKRGRP